MEYISQNQPYAIHSSFLLFLNDRDTLKNIFINPIITPYAVSNSHPLCLYGRTGFPSLLLYYIGLSLQEPHRGNAKTCSV
jgi:hypothetical protein